MTRTIIASRHRGQTPPTHSSPQTNHQTPLCPNPSPATGGATDGSRCPCGADLEGCVTPRCPNPSVATQSSAADDIQREADEADQPEYDEEDNPGLLLAAPLVPTSQYMCHNMPMRQVSPGRWECQNPDCSALNIETGRHTPAVTADSREPLPIRKPGATNPPNLPPINQPRQHNHRNQADEALHRARKARRTTRSPEGCSRSARDLGGASPAQHPHINSAAISVGR